MRMARRPIGRLITSALMQVHTPTKTGPRPSRTTSTWSIRLETAYAFGLRIRPRAGHDDNLNTSITFDPYNQPNFEAIIEAWIPMTFAVNSINRSMGLDDLYPFVISPEVTKKLEVVHDIVKSYGKDSRPLIQRVMSMIAS